MLAQAGLFQAQLQSYQVCQGAGLGLAHYLASMNFHRSLADSKLDGDDLVCLAAGDAGEYLLFPGGQAFEQALRSNHSVVQNLARLSKGQGFVDPVEQLVVAERFEDEVDVATANGLHRHGNVAMPSDENDGYGRIQCQKLFLQLKYSDAWHGYVL